MVREGGAERSGGDPTHSGIEDDLPGRLRQPAGQKRRQTHAEVLEAH